MFILKVYHYSLHAKPCYTVVRRLLFKIPVHQGVAGRSFLRCKYGVLLCSSNVNTSIPCTQNRATQLSEVTIFEIYYSKILSKFKIFFAKRSVTSTLEIVFDPKLDT